MKKYICLIILVLTSIVLKSQNTNKEYPKTFYVGYNCSDIIRKTVNLQTCSQEDSIRYYSLFNRNFEDDLGDVVFFEMKVVLIEVYINNERLLMRYKLDIDMNKLKEFYFKPYSQTIVLLIRDEDIKNIEKKLVKCFQKNEILIFDHYYVNYTEDEDDFYFVCKNIYTMKEFRKIKKEEELIKISRNNM